MGHIDLNPEAFQLIGNLNDGVISITWEYMSCDTPGGMQYHFKEGSSEFWAAIMVREHRNRIETLEYDSGGGNWVQMVREDYNFFVEAGGMGSGPYTLRITDVYGNSVVESGVQLSDGGMHHDIDGARILRPQRNTRDSRGRGLRLCRDPQTGRAPVQQASRHDETGGRNIGVGHYESNDEEGDC